MTTEKRPIKPPVKSPGTKGAPERGRPATHPHKRGVPRLEPPGPWPRTPKSR